MSTNIEIGCLLDTELFEEKMKTRVSADGTKTKRKKCPTGYKLVGNQCKRISADEKRKRSRGAKKAARKRRSSQSQTTRKANRAKKRRSQMGVK